MASFPHFFTKTIISSIRGRIDSQGNSPFWNSLGHHFLSKSLDEVFHLLEDQKISHKEIITPYPVHGALLSKKACQTIGKPHMNSTPAFKMLKNQGFSITDEIDIFDGGPKLMAELSDIHAITKSRTGFIKKISSNIENSTYSLICNQNHPFRVCYGEVSAKKEEVTLSSQVCEALQLEQGDAVRYLHIPKHH
jgi:arginine N-succinyltransferase